MLRSAVVTWFLFHCIFISLLLKYRMISWIFVYDSLYISWIWSGEQEILFYFTTPFPFNRNVGRELWPWSELEGQKAIERMYIYLIYLCLLFASVLVEYRREIILNSILRLWTHPFFFLFSYVPAIDSRFSLLYTVWYSTLVVCVTRALINPRCRVGRHSRVESHAQEGGEKVKEGEQKGRKEVSKKARIDVKGQPFITSTSYPVPRTSSRLQT
jgi:hypothetical protein